MQHFRRDAASLWHRILNTDAVQTFGELSGRLLNRDWYDGLPQPGYVGPRYTSGGVLFVGMNPGAGGKGDRPDDLQQYREVQRLKDAEVGERQKAFDELT